MNKEQKLKQIEKLKKEITKLENEVNNDGYKIGKANEVIFIEKGETFKHIALPNKECDSYNLSTISRYMAVFMEDLMETKDVLNYNVEGHCIKYCNYSLQWKVSNYFCKDTARKHFKTLEKAELAAKLLNEYHKDNKIFGFKRGGSNE